LSPLFPPLPPSPKNAPILKLRTDKTADINLPVGNQFLWFPCGIVRGALAALGITATVHAETTELPSAVFQIKTVPAKT
jgi:hypothetical protein